MSIRVTMLKNARDGFGAALIAGTTYSLDNDFAISLISSLQASDTDGVLSQPAAEPFSQGRLSDRLQSAGYANSRPAISVGILGDSIGNQNFDYSASFNGAAGDSSLSNYGFLFYWKFLSAAPLEFKNYAVPGATSADVVNLQLPSALSANHDIYIVECGVNDVSISGSGTYQNIKLVYDQVKRLGKRVVLITTTPIESFSTSKARFSIFNKAVRALLYSDPATIRMVDAKSIMSNPASSDGAAYDAASAFDLTYDTTHPNAMGAYFIGRDMDRVTRPWTELFRVGPYSNGDTENILANAGMGGVAGTLATAGTGVMADSWTATRSVATVQSKCYKARSVPITIEVGATPVLGSRCRVLGIKDYHYIVITTGTAVVTLPSSTVLFSETQPDGGGGAVFLCLPANDTERDRMSNPWYGQPYESQYIELYDTSVSNSSININQTATTGFSAGDRVQASCFIEMLESAWQGFALRIAATTSIAAKTADSFGPSYNNTNALLIEPNLKGLCETPHDYVVPATTANLALRPYIFNRTANIRTRMLMHHPIMRNLSV